MRIEPMIAFLEKRVRLSEEEKEYVRKHIPVKALNKNDFLLKEGEVSSAFYFVLSGCVRMYYEVDGLEKTTHFYTEHTFVSAYESFTQSKPAPFYLQALESTIVATITAPVAQQLLAQFPSFQVLAKIAMEEELAIYQGMIAAFVTLNPEQRYQRLRTQNPSLIQRIPQYHLATYLGVSPETLSRIRKRIQLKQS